MQRLLNFILQNRAFFTFLALEIVCFWMIVSNHAYQGAAFFNSSNAVAARMLTVSQNVSNYLHLRVVNRDLNEENARLRKSLDARPVHQLRDSSLLTLFNYEPANVVNNSVHLFRNFITLDKGSAAGIEPGMAIINNNKAVGKIKTVSKNFSVAISLVNVDENISATLKRTGNFGSVKWNGVDPHYSSLQFIPRHVVPLPGDSILTSGLNAVFPAGVLVGIITRTALAPNELFWDIQIELAQDFTRLQHVEIVKSLYRKEIDSLQNTINPVQK